MPKLDITKLFLKYYLRVPEDYIVPLGTRLQKGSLFAAVYSAPIWQKTTLRQKIISIIKRKWYPDSDLMLKEAKEVLLTDVFGTKDDYGEVLYELHTWHSDRNWNFEHLTDTDKEKVQALQSIRLLTDLLHRNSGTSPQLHLNLALYNSLVCSLMEAMIVKIPVLSVRFALELQADFAFNSIREAKHPCADELISYIYETLLIQQKIASALHDLLFLISKIQKKDEQARLTMNELDAIRLCDTIINYLKATIEKVIIVLGLIFEIKGLEGLKTHAKKLTSLDTKIPAKAKELGYFQFIWQFIQSDELQELNNLRNGINHKMGISKLQPHSHLDDKNNGQSLLELFNIMLDQHRKDTAIFICVLALLTDDLVFRAPIDFDIFLKMTN